MVSEPEGSLVLRVESSYSRKTLAARTAELQAISMAYNIPAPEPMDMKGGLQQLDFFPRTVGKLRDRDRTGRERLENESSNSIGDHG